MKYKKKGFTLVEMLVVIAIIAILAAIAFGAFSSVQKNSRDTKRKSNLSTLQSALEQYHADQNYYPASLDLSTVTAIVGIGATYLGTIPKDPQGGGSYAYQCTNNAGACSRYSLCAKMENSANATTLTSCDSNSYNYEVKVP